MPAGASQSPQEYESQQQQQQLAGTARSGSPPKGREPRSRLDRPCDACRRHKHLCMIPVRGEPCVSCKTRRKECTFHLPPTTRKRKPKGDAAAAPKESTSQPYALPTAGSWLTPTAGGPSMTSGVRGTSSVSPGSSAAAGAPVPNNNGPYPLSPYAQDSLRGIARAPHLQRYPSPPSNPHASTRDALVHQALSGGVELPPSLDPADDAEDESHFVGSGAFFGLTLRNPAAEGVASATFARQATLAFRQVSASSRLPAYFIKHPSLLYGRGPSSAQKAFEMVMEEAAAVGDDMLNKALGKFTLVTLPALPFVNAKRLEAACAGLGGNGPVPFALLAGIVAHATPYINELRPLHKQLWSQGLVGLEDEFRQPRLRTIQLALLILSSRPAENVGQSEIGLARAAGAAHLLGLHMDPTNWTLPLWERSVRKRLWWTLLIHDKWRALIYGRPSNLHKSNYNVTLPTLHDADGAPGLSPSTRLSYEAFIATCRLTEIVDKLVDEFYTVQAVVNAPTGVTRLARLEEIRAQLDEFERTLDPELQVRWSQGSASEAVPTGVKSFQLSVFGVMVVTNRLVIESLTDMRAPHSLIALNNGLVACQRLAELVSNLSTADRDQFWMPYSSHHISNCVSLLLRIALCDVHGEYHLVESATQYAVSLVDALVAAYLGWTWDVAEAALRRIITLLLLASRELPMLSNAYTAVAKALNIPVTGSDEAPLSADQLLESLGLGVGGVTSSWLETDLSWLDSGLLYGALESTIPDSSALEMSQPI
ncbi:hypothetical protein Q8F55_008383 [Vanrija albida]|uniref:Zn(2)-C6 fungal-type domain-containing protein n=1 Tax=Vanrija albida TaxID=181172 RepID=A0ABR3PW35_9TREE